MSNTTEEILSVSNTYINGATMPVSQLEQGGGFAATEVLVFNISESLLLHCYIQSVGE